MSSETPIVVTLDRPISIPGSNHYPAQARTFRAREHSVPGSDNGYYTFFGVNVGPEHTVVDVRADNVLAVVQDADKLID